MCVEGTRDMATAFTTRCPDVTVVVYIIFVQNTKWRETDHNIAFDFFICISSKNALINEYYCIMIRTYKY